MVYEQAAAGQSPQTLGWGGGGRGEGGGESHDVLWPATLLGGAESRSYGWICQLSCFTRLHLWLSSILPNPLFSPAVLDYVGRLLLKLPNARSAVLNFSAKRSAVKN